MRSDALLRGGFKRCMSLYRQSGRVLPFSIDLCAAFARQQKFTAKMARKEHEHEHEREREHNAAYWASADVHKRAVQRYARFLLLMRAYPGKGFVPTLDIDLAWHTHQLLPQHYLTYTAQMLGRVLNHNANLPVRRSLSRLFSLYLSSPLYHRASVYLYVSPLPVCAFALLTLYAAHRTRVSHTVVSVSAFGLRMAVIIVSVAVV